jgi:hypothetical protein
MQNWMKTSTVVVSIVVILLDTMTTTANAQHVVDDAIMDPSLQQSPQQNWWEFGLADPILEEVALFYLGAIAYNVVLFSLVAYDYYMSTKTLKKFSS